MERLYLRPRNYSKKPDNLTAKKVATKLAGIILSIGRALLIIGLSFVLLYPLIYMVVMAFRPMEEVLDPSVIWVSKRFTWDNIRKAWEYMSYDVAIKNTLLINIVSSLLQVAVCALTGYGFARFNFKCKKVLFSFVIFSIMIPPQLTITPLSRSMAFFNFFGLGEITKFFGLSGTVNLLDTPYPFYLLSVFGAGIKSGLFILIFRQFFRGLPREFEEAAAIDGCGFGNTFIRVILPNAIPVCISSVILSVVWYWNDYYYGSLFTPQFFTVSQQLVKLPYATGLNPDTSPHEIVTLMQAGALLAILPMLIMYIVLQRKLVQGMERSGLVG